MEKIMDKLIKNYKRKIFNILDLENDVINRLLSTKKYYEMGGYSELVKIINKLNKNNQIIEIKSSAVPSTINSFNVIVFPSRICNSIPGSILN